MVYTKLIKCTLSQKNSKSHINILHDAWSLGCNDFWLLNQQILVQYMAIFLIFVFRIGHKKVNKNLGKHLMRVANCKYGNK